MAHSQVRSSVARTIGDARSPGVAPSPDTIAAMARDSGLRSAGSNIRNWPHPEPTPKDWDRGTQTRYLRRHTHHLRPDRGYRRTGRSGPESRPDPRVGASVRPARPCGRSAHPDHCRLRVRLVKAEPTARAQNPQRSASQNTQQDTRKTGQYFLSALSNSPDKAHRFSHCAVGELTTA